MFDPALGGEAIVAHAATCPMTTRPRLRGRATLVELGPTEVDVLRLLEWLGRERGCRVVLCEGGGVLNARFFAARAVDELYLTLVRARPRWLERADNRRAAHGFEPDALPDGRLVGVRSRRRRAVSRLRVRLGRLSAQCAFAVVSGGTMNGTTCSRASKPVRYCAAACCVWNGPTRTRNHVPRPGTCASTTYALWLRARS